MSEKFFDWNHLPELMIRRSDLYPKEDIVKNYLGGIDFFDSSNGYEESLTYYPESREACYERNRSLVNRMCESYSQVDDGKRVLHIIVTHGYHVESIAVEHGGSAYFPPYCAKSGLTFAR